jgi:glycosyltransferase involved in cell wall biosynthesis
LIEAMLLGMPVAVLATTESVEVVPREAGVLSTDPDRLRDGLRALVDDHAASTAAGRAARAAALERFGVPRFLADWDAVLDRAVARHPVPAASSTSSSSSTSRRS